MAGGQEAAIAAAQSGPARACSVCWACCATPGSRTGACCPPDLAGQARVCSGGGKLRDEGVPVLHVAPLACQGWGRAGQARIPGQRPADVSGTRECCIQGGPALPALPALPLGSSGLLAALHRIAWVLMETRSRLEKDPLAQRKQYWASRLGAAATAWCRVGPGNRPRQALAMPLPPPPSPGVLAPASHPAHQTPPCRCGHIWTSQRCRRQLQHSQTRRGCRRCGRGCRLQGGGCVWDEGWVEGGGGGQGEWESRSGSLVAFAASAAVLLDAGRGRGGGTRPARGAGLPEASPGGSAAF